MGAAVLCAVCATVWCEEASDSDAASETRLLNNVRQLTFEGLRAGEGYFSASGTKLVFQSERMAENPWYQIYLMDLETGDLDRISPGHGKTTCAWIHPKGKKVLFSSTHDDPKSEELQQTELEFRASGQERRYSWDYDEHYEIYESSIRRGGYRNLTNARGYDAEGSYSPDGAKIAFASNRSAYTEPLSEEDAALFERDKSYMMDIYIMDADGSNVERLTDTLGYDGGPFFSPDGRRIAWRRFAPDGATAEVYTMNIDGSVQRQITRVGAMSWAPYYHPSGEYIIFTNNSLGFANFELFMVDVNGERGPVRVTFTYGFDGLPVFSPDGNRLAWTTNRTASGNSQIFIADWDNAAARWQLGLDKLTEVQLENVPEFSETAPDVRAADMKQHVDYLASDYMEGRRTGTLGERRATAYVAGLFKEMGLAPAGDAGTYFQEFEFTAGVSLGEASRLTLNETEEFTTDEDWRPLAFSKTGPIEASGVVFAGYGIQAPEGEGDIGEYDSFAHLDVTDKWVMAFRYMPEDISAEMRQHLGTHSSLRYKAMTVRDLGARGLILVSGPNSGVKNELVRLFFDTSLGETSVAAISVTDAAAQSLLDLADRDLKSLQDELDDGSSQMGFEIPGATLSAQIEIDQETRIGRNVLARLYAGGSEGERAIVVGAHVDHLGIGRSGSSLAQDDEAGGLHHGADDNASGVAGMLEIAQYLADQKSKGLDMQRDVLFAAWSGEELGLLGANHFTRTYLEDKKAMLTPHFVAYLNLDMIGRLDGPVVIHGVGSSSIWPGEIERRSIPADLAVNAQQEAYLPTDATAFYLKGVPFLSAFTGAHEEYHTPRDTADRVNNDGAARIAKFMALVARSLATRDEAPDYLEVQGPENLDTRANLRAYLGTIPDYTEKGEGLELSGVSAGGPADKAGLRQGDAIIELAGRKIENIYDYTFAIEALKIGQEIDVVIKRDGERLTLKVTPGSRE